MAYFQKMMTVNGGYQKVYTVTGSDSMMDGALEEPAFAALFGPVVRVKRWCVNTLPVVSLSSKAEQEAPFGTVGELY